MFGYIFSSYGRDIASHYVLISIMIICQIRLLRVCIPLAGKYTLSADGIKATAQSSNTGKKINETE